ncbi:helix-turn-helix domain-containing protein [Massilia sp. TS11]|uniref:helix-turn-helix domain-containing protein n=1 Tax=Massilia sp. TS11 TaxID=2908003 RepID=UPI001EDB71A1|nr:helix-turn-helix domain-containing protein [Massilia sp. TS11]MCG2586778.1 helix-turn-helix domain-containing protein [Massilia sp. TS11]
MDTTSVNARIAAQVRQLRAALGLSLEALAARSGVSRSTISLIERAAASPTASVLERLAAGLDVPLARLFDTPDSAPPQPLARRAEQPRWTDPVSGYIRCNLTPPQWPTALRLVEVMFPPGASVAFDNAGLSAQHTQQIWLMEGEMQLSIGATDYSLAAGDCLAMALDQPIVFRNPGSTAARYLVAVSRELTRTAA